MGARLQKGSDKACLDGPDMSTVHSDSQVLILLRKDTLPYLYTCVAKSTTSDCQYKTDCIDKHVLLWALSLAETI